MSAAGIKFMEVHQDFVLKLKIKASDGKWQIRRVRLPRIVDKSGRVSYDELVGLVLTFTFLDNAPDNYSVSLTYFDADEDTVTIASTDELVDAIEQFAGKKLLRISTEVNPKSASSSSKNPHIPSVTTPNQAPARDMSLGEQGLHPSLQTALESFVGLLVTAVTSLQGGLADLEAVPRQNGVATDTNPTKAPPPADNDGEVTSNVVPPRDVEETSEGSGLTINPPPVDMEEEKEEPRPFIHGRHTCDSCLTTPIIGKRYNAQNLPDYDLCENCYINYNGNEVKFEAVELDRDRAFQDRWHRRRDRIQNLGKVPKSQQCGRGRRWGQGLHQNATRADATLTDEQKGSRPIRNDQQADSPAAHTCPRTLPHKHIRPGFSGELPSHGPPPHWANLGPHMMPHLSPHMMPHLSPHMMPHLSPHHGPPPHHFGPPPHHHWPHHEPLLTHFTGHRPHKPASAPGGADDALMKAIRRSLRDIAPEDSTVSNETDSVSSPKDDVATLGTAAPEDASVVAVDLPNEKLADQRPHDSQTALEEPDECGQDPMQEESNSQPVADEWVAEAYDGSEDNNVSNPSITTDEAMSSKKTNDESFASDAIGSGDIAEAMGATLDMVAGVISEMLFEADAHNRGPVADNEVASTGELILDYTPAEQAPIEENEWQLVNTDTNKSEKEMNPEDEIGRAAEMLGSALFNSDMQNSVENVSALSSSDSFSIPSTVPSITSISRVADAQRTRWASQLSTLLELGFEERICIETLELLQAANIGVDSGDDISVTQVVNAMMG